MAEKSGEITIKGLLPSAKYARGWRSQGRNESLSRAGVHQPAPALFHKVANVTAADRNIYIERVYIIFFVIFFINKTHTHISGNSCKNVFICSKHNTYKEET